MADYKHTLNLPNTSFPMKANLAKKEVEVLAQWETLQLYTKLRKHGENRKKFILHDGPPYANGHTHIGHAVNKILKDIIVKSKTLSGFDAPFVPGWDCHGLPIEVNVEKKLGKPGHKIGAKAFRQACRDYATCQIATQKSEFKRLGVFADWDNPYLTMDFKFEAETIRSLATIVRKGHLQQGYKPVYWCLDCRSALAEAEVEYADKKSLAIDVGFTVVNFAEAQARMGLALAEGKLIVPIWTTTPWTLPANQAVAVNPSLPYALVACPNNTYFVIAEDLVESVMQRYVISDYTLVKTMPGNLLAGLLVQHPFYSRHVPIVTGDHVTVDSGTGAVHTAPAHGQEDFLMGKLFQLPLDNPVGDDGCYVASTPHLAGLFVRQADDAIIALLKEAQALLYSERISHSYPHCWRHKTPLIFRATPQWFISMSQASLRQDALAAINRVNWLPEWGQARIYAMIENRPDWCISRQRTWGVPIPLFVHAQTGDLHPETLAIMERVASEVEKSGIEAWFELSREALLGADAADYIKCTDILDVWFDSGVTHATVLRQHAGLSSPADLYLEGSDQHRGWFHSSLLTAIAMYSKEPYRTVLTHGYAVDGQGRKMSKSVGNVVAPEKVINTLGADILRLWVASIDYRTEMTVSDEILTRISETYRRLRNTARFLLANLDGFDPSRDLVAPDAMVWLDRWVVAQAQQLQESIISAYDAYQFHLIYQKIHHFCAIDLGGFYLDIIKDRQYTMQTSSVARRSAQTAMYHLIEAMVRWLAPILSFTAEEIWQAMPGQRNESVFLNDWYTGLFSLGDNPMLSHNSWESIKSVRNAVNKELEIQRNAGKIGAPLEAGLTLYCNDALQDTLNSLQNELRFVMITSSADVRPLAVATADSVVTEVTGLRLSVQPLVYAKCGRCWHRCEDVGSHPVHTTLCHRCIENVDGQGEVRKYA